MKTRDTWSLLTGIMDNKLTIDPDPELLTTLRTVARQTNAEWAEKLGSTKVLRSLASNLVVQYLNYVILLVVSIHDTVITIRTVRGDNKDPLTQFLRDQGVVNEPDVMKPDSTTVFSFAVQSPKDSVKERSMVCTETTRSMDDVPRVLV